jgi:hypothetical protein
VKKTATALWMEPTYGAISSEDSGRVSSLLTDKEYRTLLRLRLVRLGCNFLPAGTSFPIGQHAVLCGKAAVSTGNVCTQKLDSGGVPTPADEFRVFFIFEKHKFIHPNDAHFSMKR